MITLCVWSYDTVDGARRLEQRMSEGAGGDVVLLDGALVTWLPGRVSPTVRELHAVARTAGLGVGFWGLLLGIAVSGPELQTLAGAPSTDLDGALAGIGIDATVLADLRVGLRPGGSAVAVVCAEAAACDIDRAAHAPAGPDVSTVVRRPLGRGEGEALLRVFSA